MRIVQKQTRSFRRQRTIAKGRTITTGISASPLSYSGLLKDFASRPDKRKKWKSEFYWKQFIQLIDPEYKNESKMEYDGKVFNLDKHNTKLQGYIDKEKNVLGEVLQNADSLLDKDSMKKLGKKNFQGKDVIKKLIRWLSN